MLGIITKIDQMQMTDGEVLLFCVENIRVLDLIRKPMLCQPFPKAPSLVQLQKSTLQKIIDRL